ncbi:MAG: DNA polymerase III subunit chi [Pseudomonadota bacterium]
MGAAWFYHLTRSPVENTLGVLLPKALSAGWRVAVRCPNEDVLDRLDEALWRGDGFLPHGRAGGAHDADQPVLLTTATRAANDPNCLMVLGQSEIATEEVNTLDRVCLLFEGADPTAVEAARTRWKRLTEAGVSAVYWSEETGSWVKKAEAGGD